MKSISLNPQVPANVTEASTHSGSHSTRSLPSGWRLLCHKVLRDRPAVIGLMIIGLLVCTALFAPYIAPFPEDISATHPANRLRAPSWTHPLGTDTMGRDIYSRVLFGGRITLLVSFTVVGACLLVGVSTGLVAGYCNNILSHFIMRTADIFLAVPRVILALAMAQALGPSLPNLILALTVTYWPGSRSSWRPRPSRSKPARLSKRPTP